MKRLREETSSIHQQLEETPLSMAVMAPVVSTEAYAHYLQAMLAIHKGIEEKVFPVTAAVISDIEQRRKTELIRKDLEELGSGFTDYTEPFADENYHDELAFNLGILYVSEGSTLGGKVILKNVLAASESGFAGASRFLNAYGDQTGSRWKSFLSALDNYQSGVGEVMRDSIIEGAVYGFRRTADLFNNAVAK